jgi:multicomponent Na+:H+ antiporter subunit D
MPSLVIAFEVERLFVSKWYLNFATVEGGWYAVAALVVIGTLMAMAYTWRVALVVKFAASGSDPIPGVCANSLMATEILAPANVYPGMNACLNLGAATQTVPPLLRTGP